MPDFSLNEARQLFGYLESNESERFFSRVADDVHWTVMGTHPLAGSYHSKEDFLNATFRRLNRILQEGVVLKVTHVYSDGNTVIVEMKSLSTAKNGMPFNNTYCWVCTFDAAKKITSVRAYLDSAIVQQLIDENET